MADYTAVPENANVPDANDVAFDITDPGGTTGVVITVTGDDGSSATLTTNGSMGTRNIFVTPNNSGTGGRTILYTYTNDGGLVDPDPTLVRIWSIATGYTVSATGLVPGVARPVLIFPIGGDSFPSGTSVNVTIDGQTTTITATIGDTQASNVITCPTAGTFASTCSNNEGWTNPDPSVTVHASDYTLTASKSNPVVGEAVTITIHDVTNFVGGFDFLCSDSAFGTFVPNTPIPFSDGGTFTYTPVSSGSLSMAASSGGSAVDPAPIAFTVYAEATGYDISVTGPHLVGQEDTVVLTPTPGGTAFPVGTTISVVDSLHNQYDVTDLAASGTMASYPITPATMGTHTLTPTNGAALTDPDPIDVEVTVPSGVVLIEDE